MNGCKIQMFKEFKGIVRGGLDNLLFSGGFKIWFDVRYYFYQYNSDIEKFILLYIYIL